MSALYIHIPFCKQKCHYCNFFSTASLKYKAEIVNSICKELDLKKDYLPSKSLRSIYFGGGTPSILNEQELATIFEKIYSIYSVDSNCEITFEANPDDIVPMSIKQFNTLGINRLSIGIQSFNDDILHKLNRVHSGRDAINSVRLSQESGITNLNIDLIYGIPGLSLDMWKKELDTFLSFNIPHLSAYSLTLEPKTALDVLIKKKKYPSLNEEESIEHLNYLVDYLDANNYNQYEISNFAISGKESLHNSNYWKNQAYLGIGPSANSFNLVSRDWNSSSIKNYMRDIEKGKSYEGNEILSDNDKFNEYIMLGFRTIWGVNLEIIEKRYGKIYLDHLVNYLRENKRKDTFVIASNSVKLTKKAMRFADGIASDIFI